MSVLQQHDTFLYGFKEETETGNKYSTLPTLPTLHVGTCLYSHVRYLPSTALYIHVHQRFSKRKEEWKNGRKGWMQPHVIAYVNNVPRGVG